MVTQHKNSGSFEEHWIETKPQIFWGEIAPCNHILQIYESDDVILNSLEGFVTTGFDAAESVIIIATDEHIRGLNKRLIAAGYDLKRLQEEDQYLPLNAHETLEKFMVNDWPDEKKFINVVTNVVSLAKGKFNRKVRAYGEMVAILWAKGNNGATVNLEQLWNKFCATEQFCLFCAYPKTGFTQDVEQSIFHICNQHSKLIVGDSKSSSQIFYMNM
jgi:hypothetical protein